jgi:hypothetical protein
LLTAAGTAGGNGTLICVFIDVKAMVGGEANFGVAGREQRATTRRRGRDLLTTLAPGHV